MEQCGGVTERSTDSSTNREEDKEQGTTSTLPVRLVAKAKQGHVDYKQSISLLPSKSLLVRSWCIRSVKIQKNESETEFQKKISLQY